MIVRAEHAISSPLVPPDEESFGLVVVIIKRFCVQSDPDVSPISRPRFGQSEYLGADSVRPKRGEHVNLDEDHLTRVARIEIENNQTQFSRVVTRPQQYNFVGSMNLRTLAERA